MTGRREIPRLHVITDTAVLQRPHFLAEARSVLAACAAWSGRLHHWDSVDAPHVASGGPGSFDRSGASEGAAPPAMALHLRGRVSGRHLHDLAAGLLPAARTAGALLLINDRIDIAHAADADGVQLGQGSLPVELARDILKPSAIVGASVHGGAEAAVAARADFLIVGNIWETASHPGRPARGLEVLGEVKEAVSKAGRPSIIAIGGVTPDRVAPALASGAGGVAVLGGIWSAATPSEAAFRYLEALQTEQQPRDPDQ